MNLKSRKNASVNKVSSPLDTFGSAVLQVIAQDLVWRDVSQLVAVRANKCRIIMITISSQGKLHKMAMCLPPLLGAVPGSQRRSGDNSGELSSAGSF